MLYKYKSDYEKIAMGLLSFIPDLKDIAHLQSEIKWYTAEDDRSLFLWKNPNGDFIGILGVEITDDLLIIRHIAVSPSARNEGLTYAMLSDLAARYPHCKLMGNIETASIINKWECKKDD
ncbi:GNAT family N-acetyltransferase [Ligilactobacillus ceti]|uniref:RibT protein n=1 Tax=Ligilactobacillus ceti DSM 22408 TaxID=1122146 RepID=A0A0R2KHT2_9LACO|nr:GNAT family N-acetyltransferase [Ligilactobacillus ceti]KRN88895.1 RibT protein [Ligilactobacillus ceti DSM 22408]